MDKYTKELMDSSITGGKDPVSDVVNGLRSIHQSIKEKMRSIVSQNLSGYAELTAMRTCVCILLRLYAIKRDEAQKMIVPAQIHMLLLCSEKNLEHTVMR
jgi:hypothetical protein